MTKPSPGPWKWSSDQAGAELLDAEGKPLSVTMGFGSRTNGRLIEAASEMYALLEECADVAEYDSGGLRERIQALLKRIQDVPEAP